MDADATENKEIAIRSSRRAHPDLLPDIIPQLLLSVPAGEYRWTFGK